MRVPKHVLTLAVGVPIGGVAVAGATVAVDAGAAGSGTTYYACLSHKGGLSKVGTTAPTCPSTSTVISWSQTGPQGIQGVQGIQGAQGPPGPLNPAFGTNTSVASLSGTGEPCTIGQVILNAGVVYDGIPADGRLLPITGNTALFSVIGVDYGGNGTSNFAVPDLRSAAPSGLTYSICSSGVFPSTN